MKRIALDTCPVCGDKVASGQKSGFVFYGRPVHGPCIPRLTGVAVGPVKSAKREGKR